MARLEVKGAGGRNCDVCKKLGDQKSFQKGLRVKIYEAYDCENCPIWTDRPSRENEIILSLYRCLPDSYDNIGVKTFTTSDVISMFKLKDVAEELWEEYYERILYFHRRLVDESKKKTKKERNSKKKRTGDRASTKRGSGLLRRVRK